MGNVRRNEARSLPRVSQTFFHAFASIAKSTSDISVSEKLYSYVLVDLPHKSNSSDEHEKFLEKHRNRQYRA